MNGIVCSCETMYFLGFTNKCCVRANVTRCGCEFMVVLRWFCLVYLIFESDGVSKGQKGGKDSDCQWN
jgi:hypothetical protein